MSAQGRAIPPGAYRDEPCRHASRARRKRAAWGEEEYAIYARHRWRVEGTHGTASPSALEPVAHQWRPLYGLARAIRRGLDNMKIQALLTAIAMNLKKLANAALRVIRVILEIGAAQSAPKTA